MRYLFMSCICCRFWVCIENAGFSIAGALSMYCDRCRTPFRHCNAMFGMVKLVRMVESGERLDWGWKVQCWFPWASKVRIEMWFLELCIYMYFAIYIYRSSVANTSWELSFQGVRKRNLLRYQSSLTQVVPAKFHSQASRPGSHIPIIPFMRLVGVQWVSWSASVGYEPWGEYTRWVYPPPPLFT